MVIVLIVLTFLAKRTTFGRHVYAVGGNAEAARRAGINVPRIRILVFMISGATAALGGIILAAYVNSVALTFPPGTLLLNSIAAAVIGGVSLFGGRGEVRGALLGSLVIATVVERPRHRRLLERHDLHRHGADPPLRRHARHDRAPPAGPLRPVNLGGTQGSPTSPLLPGLGSHLVRVVRDLGRVSAFAVAFVAGRPATNA